MRTETPASPQKSSFLLAQPAGSGLSSAHSPRLVIFNADDFGDTPRINAAVRRAHTEGVLTSASLMVGGSAWQEAVAIARQTPTLGVGLHLVVTESRAVLPSAQIPHLVDASGRFSPDLFRVGLRYAFSRTAQQALRQEMTAQFDRFAATGLEWSHVDGHQHFHVHPFVWDTLLTLCREYGVHRLRLPREEFRQHWRTGGEGGGLNTIAGLCFRLLGRRHRRRLSSQKPPAGRAWFLCDRVYGHLQSGKMHSGYVQPLLGRLQGQTNEIYFHPGAAHAQPLPPAHNQNGIEDVEFAALMDPTLRAAMERQNLLPAHYAEAEKRLEAEGRRPE